MERKYISCGGRENFSSFSCSCGWSNQIDMRQMNRWKNQIYYICNIGFHNNMRPEETRQLSFICHIELRRRDRRLGAGGRAWVIVWGSTREEGNSQFTWRWKINVGAIFNNGTQSTLIKGTLLDSSLSHTTSY